MPPSLLLVARPGALPPPPAAGTVAVLDLAFAHGDRYATVTRPFIAALGDRLALWLDHHDHPAWRDYDHDARFVLTGKLLARACPQLVTPARVAAAGAVHHVVAHADFDGCMAAAKFLRGGTAPYREADEDARHADAPGQGFTCSPRGLRLLHAIEQTQATTRETAMLAFLSDITRSLVHDQEPAELTVALDALDAAFVRRRESLLGHLAQARRPHPNVLLVDLPAAVKTADRKVILRAMEAEARVAVVRQGRWLTLATFDDDDVTGIDLSSLPGLAGQRGLAWGKAAWEPVSRALVRLLRGA